MIMAIITSSTLLILLSILIISPTINARLLFSSCIDQHGNYTTNSTYHTNLNSLLPSLISNASLGAATRNSAGFYTSSYGESPDKVYAALLCRGDLKLDDCRSCLNESRLLLPHDCPNRKAAVIWYDECTLRYSDVYFTGRMSTRPGFALLNKQNLTSTYDEFNERFEALFENLRMRAAAGTGSPSNFAAGSVNVTRDVLVYGLFQCTPDLSGPDCNDCVVDGIRFLHSCCYGSPIVYVGLLSCNVVYSLSQFYDSSVDVRIQSPSSPPSPPPQLPPASQPITNGTASNGNVRKSGRFQIVIVIAVPSIACFLVLVICICLCLRMRMTKKTQTRLPFETEEDTDHHTAKSLQLDFRTIISSTNNFSEANKIGQGGFGAVYRGRLSNGQDLAVKRLINNHTVSKQKDLEFKNEVLLVAKLGHRNLVSLLGFCLEKNERILVYKFMPNSSLDHFLFDPYKRPYFDWNPRYMIIRGVARGLLYLHEESPLKIIHRDLKAGNILLDAKMNPKISDFGTARLFADLDQSREKTKQIAGTYGYMAPEYARKGEFSVKSDVFSFGVLVLEIICGQTVKDFHDGENLESLVTYAWKIFKKGEAMKLVDPRMRGASQHEIIRCVHIGLLCVQEKAVDRPTMGSVVLMLSSYSVSLPRPSRPAYFVQSNSQSGRVTESNQSGNNPAQVSRNNVSLITEVSPR